jgi:two-component system LytT family response regulator
MRRGDQDHGARVPMQATQAHSGRYRMKNIRTLGDRLAVKSPGRLFFIRTADIDWCEAAGNYVRLHVGSSKHLVRHTIERLASTLHPEQFVRIHRCSLVNVERIQELHSTGNERLVVLHGGTRLALSRAGWNELQGRLGQLPSVEHRPS